MVAVMTSVCVIADVSWQHDVLVMALVSCGMGMLEAHGDSSKKELG